MRKRAALALALFLIAPLASATFRTWDGGGGDPFWSTAANWAGDVAPVAGDDLDFPAGAAQLTNNNDLGVTFGRITISASGYLLQGAAINLSGGIQNLYTSGTSRIHAQLNATAAQTIQVPLNGVLRITTGISTAATLTFDVPYTGGVIQVEGPITGPGSINKIGDGSLILLADSTYGGTTTVGSGVLFANDPVGGGNATSSGPVSVGAFGGVRGTGSVGNVTVGGFISAGTLADPSLTTGNLSFTPSHSVQLTMLSPTVPQQLDVNGTADLTNAMLVFSFSLANIPAPGTQLMIVDNDGADPVIGTFVFLPEGTAFAAGLPFVYFLITYAGGDGNDVVLTTMGADLVVTKVADDPTPVVGQTVTFTITITNAGPTYAPGVILGDFLPPGLAFVSWTPSQGTCGIGSCNLGTLNVGATATVTLVTTVTAAGSITNTATAVSDVVSVGGGHSTATATLNAVAANAAGAPIDGRALAALATLLAVAGALILRR